MTIKAILLGLLGVIILNGYTYFNDAVLHQPPLVNNFMPISIFGGLILFLVTINPLLRYLNPKLCFSGKELSVVLSLVLFSACIPGSNLMRTFTNLLVQPHHLAKINPDWQTFDVIKLAPEGALADVTKDEGTVINGFRRGLSTNLDQIGLSDVPWEAFKPALWFWLPALLLFWIALIGLSLTVHRQWAHHEQLAYPIARFTNWLLPDNKGKSAIPAMLKSKLFWMGMTAVFLIHMNNYFGLWAEYWWESIKWIPIKLNWSGGLQPLKSFSDFLVKGGVEILFSASLFFTAIGFGYFLAKEVSFSLGIAPFLYVILRAVLLDYDIKAQEPKFVSSITFGAYIAMAFAIFYTGRHYYVSVLKKAVFPIGKSVVPREAAWGLRTFIACMAILLVLLMQSGFDWLMASLFLATVTIIYLVMSRIVAETGVFLIQAGILPATLFLVLMGPQALGPETIMLLFLFSTVFIIDPRDGLMPFVVNSFRILDFQNVKPGRVAPLGGIALVIGLAVAIPATLYFQYSYGSDPKDAYATKMVPEAPFKKTVENIVRLKGQGILEAASEKTGLDRLSAISPPEKQYAWPLLLGAGLVIATMFARLRIPGWPIHPVLFLVWGTFPIKFLYLSLLIGWLIKSLVTRLGGEGTYRRIQPLMVGLIAGEMSAGLMAILIGFLYFLFTGQEPPIEPFSIFIG